MMPIHSSGLDCGPAVGYAAGFLWDGPRLTKLGILKDRHWQRSWVMLLSPCNNRLPLPALMQRFLLHQRVAGAFAPFVSVHRDVSVAHEDFSKVVDAVVCISISRVSGHSKFYDGKNWVWEISHRCSVRNFPGSRA